MRVVNTNVATLPWSASCRQQTCRTIHDHRARGVVVSHPYSKRDEEREREEKARGERESGGKARPPAGK